jgi:hypothetical protein
MPDSMVGPRTISLSWLQEPSEKDRTSLLDFTRGVLCSLSTSESGQAAPIHVTQIRRSFAKLGSPALYRAGLRLAELLREAEPLYGGYWLPTPYRVIDLNGELVFVGAATSVHPLLADVKVDGLCRLIAPGAAEHLPRQSLSSWMGLVPEDPRTIVPEFKDGHSQAEAATSHLMGVQYLKIVSDSATGRTRFVWIDRALATLPAEQIAICRQTYHGRVRHFSARLRNNVLATEAPIRVSVSRLLFALSRPLGRPVAALIRPKEGGTEVTVTERLPLAEFRLALLLSREIIRSGRTTTFILSPKLASNLCEKLELLGCYMETQT